ncbi:MAG TPA: type II toxin-antitoxin system RelE/ParE family toxin [Tepidisphaeraceae bacterium]|nr:type II toxin-antitoxin system RelE/ParE family toxin [Tepidisphaeraceae bacterium]
MGRAKYVITDSAKADIRAIIGYVRERSPLASKRVRSRLYSDIRRLAEFPHIGHVREDVTLQSLRFWCVYSYLIVYRPERKPIEIVRVLHGARDLPGFFK